MPTIDMTPVDALLLLSFGGPEGPDDVLPFMVNVTRGRGIPAERLVEVSAHYQRFGGTSPINNQNREFLDALRPALVDAGIDLPLYWGNRNWHPFLGEVMAELADCGHRRVLVWATSVYSSYSGCRQYREDLADALAPLGERAPVVEKVRHGFDHPGFIEPFADAVVAALLELPVELRSGARLVFTTHSIPSSMARTAGPTTAPSGSPELGARPEQGSYVAQHEVVAGLVAERVVARTGLGQQWDLVYQSRSGAPTIPWLEPDIDVHLEALAAQGVQAVVVIPIGFVSDHMEVVWDLDTQARETAARVGLTMTRAATPGNDPRMVAMVVELFAERLRAAAPRLPGVAHELRTALSPLGPCWDRCAVDCCPNPALLRGPSPSGGTDARSALRVAACGADDARVDAVRTGQLPGAAPQTGWAPKNAHPDMTSQPAASGRPGSGA